MAGTVREVGHRTDHLQPAPLLILMVLFSVPLLVVFLCLAPDGSGAFSFELSQLLTCVSPHCEGLRALFGSVLLSG